MNSTIENWVSYRLIGKESPFNELATTNVPELVPKVPNAFAFKFVQIVKLANNRLTTIESISDWYYWGAEVSAQELYEICKKNPDDVLSKERLDKLHSKDGEHYASRGVILENGEIIPLFHGEVVFPLIKITDLF